MKRGYGTAFSTPAARRARQAGVVVNTFSPVSRSVPGPSTIVRSRRRFYSRVLGRSTGAIVATAERKYFDSLVSAAAITANTTAPGVNDPATLNTLFAPIQGSGINNRVGRKVLMHWVHVRGMVNFGVPTAQATPQKCPELRLALVLDKQTNAAQAAGTTVFMSPATATAILANCTFMNLDNLGRFKILKDKRFASKDTNTGNDAATTVSQAPDQVPFNWLYRFKGAGVPVHFNATNGGTVADIVDASLHMYANICVTGWTPVLSYNARICYTDA